MIPEAAIEAAKGAMLSKDGRNLPGEDWEDWQLRVAKLMLEAAAPHIEEAAYNRGFDDGHLAGQESMETE